MEEAEPLLRRVDRGVSTLHGHPLGGLADFEHWSMMRAGYIIYAMERNGAPCRVSRLG